MIILVLFFNNSSCMLYQFWPRASPLVLVIFHNHYLNLHECLPFCAWVLLFFIQSHFIVLLCSQFQVPHQTTTTARIPSMELKESKDLNSLSTLGVTLQQDFLQLYTGIIITPKIIFMAGQTRICHQSVVSHMGKRYTFLNSYDFQE